MIEPIEILLSYKDCQRHKRSSCSYGEFALDEMSEIIKLQTEIKNGTYEIGESTAFVVTRPKYREVFAANFRDRIVHHFLMLRSLDLFEDKFIDDSYNCRAGKGTWYGVTRIQEMLQEYDDGWILKCDLKSFFMTIDKHLLANMLEKFLRDNYKGDDMETIVSLTKQIVLHRPELNCYKKGSEERWNNLPKDKSLFYTEGYRGLAIGNLTSQIYANFYLSFFDEWMVSHDWLSYGRYVDDFVVFAKDKNKLLKLLPEIRKWLWDNLHLTLHPDKVYIQPIHHGLSFCGYIIRKDVIYPGKRLASNAITLIKKYNKKSINESWMLNHIENFAQRYNSYTGFLIHTRSYRLRKKMWEMLSPNIKKYLYINGKLSVVHVRKRYKQINIRKDELRYCHKTNRRVRAI